MTDVDYPDPPDPAQLFMWRLVPNYGEKIAQYRQDLYEREKVRVDALRRAAEEELSIDALFAAIHGDERIGEMFRSAVASAQRATSDAKIRLLGKALASGALAADDAQVDAAEELMRIATELEATDLRALLLIDQSQSGVEQPETLLSRRGFDPTIVWPILARLQRLGLVTVEQDPRINDPDDRHSDFVDANALWTVTDTGRAVLELIQSGRAAE